MKIILDRARIWSIVAACLLALASSAVSVGAADANAGTDTGMFTHEKIIFVNFSEEPIHVYFIDKSHDGAWREPMIIDPYDTYTGNTFSGHKFTYEWKGANNYAHVYSRSNVEVQTEGKADTDNIIPQVHVLGGMDQPETKKVVCGTTKGDIHINVRPFWSPLGAARFLYLAHEARYYDGCALNRVVDKFLTQFGIGADYEERTQYRHPNREIYDDPHLDPPIRFRPGTMSYAGKGEHTRSTEVFIVMPNAPRVTLEYFGKTNTWETPFGYVEPDDLEIVGSWYKYGDMPPYGDGPHPQKIYAQGGYDYLRKEFPEMDYIKGCAVVPEADMNDPSITGLSYEDLASYVFDYIEEEL